MRVRTFLDLLLFKTRANMRTEVSELYLNYLWWVIDPILTMGTLYVVFGVLLQNGVDNYVGFLLCGVTMWQWFARTVQNSAGSIVDNRALMLQVSIPKFFFPVEVVLRDCFKNLFAVFLLLAFFLFYPTPVSATWFALPIIMLVQFVLTLAISILCAAVVPFIQDLRFVISTAIQLLFFASGVFFSVDDMVVPDKRWIVYLNPIAGLLTNYREALMRAHWPNWNYLLIVFCASCALLVFSFFVVQKLDHLYPHKC